MSVEIIGKFKASTPKAVSWYFLLSYDVISLYNIIRIERRIKMAGQGLAIKWILFPEDLSQAYEVRRKVFVEEQNCPPEDEFDVIDKISEHAVLMDSDDNALATARIFERSPEQASLGRLAVLKEHRGKGYGFTIVDHCLQRLKKQGYPDVLIHAQTHAISFYENLGFEVIGDEFMEDNIPHVEMLHKFDDHSAIFFENTQI